MNRCLFHILFLQCLLFAFNVNGQVHTETIPHSETSIDLVKKKIPFIKKFVDKIETRIDSSQFYKFSSKQIKPVKYSIETKFLKNIGYGNLIKIKTNESHFETPKEKSFEGFEMIDNSNYSISNISVESGLISNNVTKSFEDSQGNVWIGYTSGGVSKLNSNKISHYNLNTGISSDLVNDIIEFDNSIWIATFGGGIFKIHDNKLTTISKAEDFPSNHVLSFCVDNNRNLWISTYDRGLIRFQQNKFYHYKQIHPSVSLNISKIVLDSINSQIWFFDDHNNVVSIDNTYNASIINIVNKPINYSIIDCDVTKDGFVAILNDARLAKFSKKIVSVTSIGNEGEFTKVLCAKSGNIWIANDKGNLIVNNGENFTTLNHSHGLGKEIISNLNLDKSGNIWISTFGEGVFMTYPSSFVSILNDNDSFYLNSNVISSCGNSLTFTTKDGVSILNNDNIIVHYNHPKLKNIKGIATDSHKIWLANFDGVYELSNDSLFMYYHELTANSGYNSSTNIQYTKDILYVNNYNHGWLEFDEKKNEWVCYSKIKDITFTTSLFVDSQERKWIASTKGGIIFVKNDKQYILKENVGIVTDFTEDTIGNIWISTSSGLFEYKKSGILRKHIFNTEINTNFKSIQFSEKYNSLWIGSSNNLLFYNFNEGFVNIYNKHSGINGISFARSAKVVLDPFIYWTTNKAIVKFTPFVFQKKIGTARIYLSSIDLDFENIDYEQLRKNKEIKFDSIYRNIPINPTFQKNNKTINFNFTSNFWGKESNIIYYYNLDNSSNWIGPIVNDVITLSNLSVGDHILKVKGVGFNQSDSNIVEYKFSISQPFYKELWFIILIILITFSVGLLVFIVRSNFDFSNFKSYSTYSIYLKRLRFMALSFAFIFPLMEWLTTEFFSILKPHWWQIILIALSGLIFIFYTRLKKVSETSISLFALINCCLITLFLIYRVDLESYNPLLTMELIIIIAFSTIVFDNMRLFLIYWSVCITATVYVGTFLDYSTSNAVTYIFGSILILLFSFVFHIFQVNKIGKIVFADKILNTYDKLVLVYNNQGDVVYVNPYLNKFFQKEDNFILGAEWYNLRECNASETERIRANIGNQIVYLNPYKIIDETIYSELHKENRLIEWSFQIIENEYLMAIGSDVTFVREQQSRISLLSKVSETVSNGVVIRDSNDNIVWCNESFEKLIDYSLEELIGKRPSKFFNFPDFYLNQLKQFEENQGNNMVSIEIPILNKSNEIQWILMNDTVVYNDNGELIQFISIVSDITENKRKEEEIKELSIVAQSVTNGVIITTPEGIVKWCNESFQRICGYSLEEIIGNRPSSFFKTPDFFKDELQSYVSEGPIFHSSKRIAHYNKKGEIIWLLINTTPIYDQKDNLVQIIEVVTDITEQKNQETDFERLSLVAQHSQNPIIIMQSDMTIEWVNGAFVKEFHYTEDEVIGLFPGKLLKGDKSDKTSINKLEKTLLQGKKGKNEFLLYDKFGTSIWISVTVDPVYDKKGNVSKYICLMQNIQQVKEAQEIIAIKNKDITDSINYAKRIQTALLPNLRLLKKNLPDFFVYYKPKDVVSGDFYYMEFAHNKVIIAIADCTGHGVPGAMMTSIGASGLNNAILDKKLSDPAKILEHLDLYIKNSLSASNEDLTDGMDLGLIAFDFEHNTIEYCGAKRPLILINEKGDVNTIDGIKRSIGEFTFGDGVQFITTTIPVENNLRLYCFSDGIPDQFGGSKRKKLYFINFLKILSKIHKLPMKDQQIEMEKMILNWTNNFEIPQTDDMVLFGTTVTQEYFNKMNSVISILKD